MNIAPFRGLRYDLALLSERGVKNPAAAVTAPPYDVISPSEHRSLLEASEFNITALTLGDLPGAASSYSERGEKLARWIESGILLEDGEPGMYVYQIDYPLPNETSSGDKARRRFRGLVALGKLHPFADGVVLPHERTFPKVVDDRLQLLAATRTHLESIALLYSDPEKTIDSLLAAATTREPSIEVEPKSGERHALYRIGDPETSRGLVERFKGQYVIIADGHHRYTTGQRFHEEGGAGIVGSGWQLMTFANLYDDGLTILATHRLVRLRGVSADEAFETLLGKFAEVGPGEAPDVCMETATRSAAVRFPAGVRGSRAGVEATSYALLESVVLGDWLDGYVVENGVSYFKEGTGEKAALESGAGDLLFRMQPVGREEFQRVVEGGEVYPHKTTYFYPKLWSGLVLWRLADV